MALVSARRFCGFITVSISRCPSPSTWVCVALDPLRVGDGLAQHLVAAAKAQHVPAAPYMRGQIDIPAIGAEIGQIGNGGFAAGDQHQIGIAGQGAGQTG